MSGETKFLDGYGLAALALIAIMATGVLPWQDSVILHTAARVLGLEMPTTGCGDIEDPADAKALPGVEGERDRPVSS
ncbi:hypothetical protein PPSIR1_16155 [Plesiocystis pacifica SIR-1]|uniref:Uncharacterized protein n=1 Tax=Plesiocystis pacifica SIR-1 TaxID=391625 RepID=A6GJ51_9BACT|nr:hypothetical protein [Plesiocystis pacifica]EDM74089.1 hypothetical protein PPSIR1_16155 [Plesiocystis pacifica SIR-1]